MEQPPQKSTPLESGPIGKLMRRCSVPTALTLMVSYLHNIADQIFAGQGAGITGMAATNAAFPLNIVTVALPRRHRARRGRVVFAVTFLGWRRKKRLQWGKTCVIVLYIKA